MNLKIGKVLTSKSVGTGPSSYEKRIYRAAVSQRLRNTVVDRLKTSQQIFVFIIGLKLLESFLNILNAIQCRFT